MERHQDGSKFYPLINLSEIHFFFLLLYFVIHLFLVEFLIKKTCLFQMHFMLLFSRQGKLRLQKWYVAQPDKVRKKTTRELVTTILSRKPKMCKFELNF